MKKLLIITLAAALMLTACGQPQTSSSNIENSQISSNSVVESSSSEVSSSETLPKETEEIKQLTTEEKLEDFEEYYNIMINHYPAGKVEKEDFGLDFGAKRDFFLQKVRETKNDFEFYVLMDAIHGGHLGHHEWVLSPDNLDYSYVFVNEEFIRYTFNIEKLNDRMARSVEKYGKETYKKYKGNIHSFLYISNGEYICVNNDSSLKGCILFEINGKPVSESVGDYLSTGTLEFDENKRLYRTSLFFNEKDGEPVKLKLKTPEGEIIERDMFVNPYAEYASYYYGYGDFQYIHRNENSKKEPLMTHIDKDNNYSYIYVDTFMDMSEEWKNKLIEKATEATADVDNIIVDLRGNGGGSPYISLELTYPLFHNEDAKFEYECRLDGDDKSFFRIINSRAEWDYYKIIVEVESNNNTTYIKGILTPHSNENSPKNKNIYYLIDDDCGSATEQYLAMIKANKLATLIGTKSSGDGLIHGTAGYPLKNSGLIIANTPYESFNPDGTNNTIYGTTPDIYCWQSMEDYQKRIEMAQNGENLYTFENMLQWDTVLKRAVEEITK